MSIWVSKEPSRLDKLVLAFWHHWTKIIFSKKCKKLKFQYFLCIFLQYPLKNDCSIAQFMIAQLGEEGEKLIEFDQNFACRLSIYKIRGKCNAFNHFWKKFFLTHPSMTSWGWAGPSLFDLVEIGLRRVEISYSKCLSVFLKQRSARVSKKSRSRQFSPSLGKSQSRKTLNWSLGKVSVSIDLNMFSLKKSQSLKETENLSLEKFSVSTISIDSLGDY